MEFRGSWSSFFMYLQYFTVVQLYMCSSKQKIQGGPRAQEGTRTTGTRRALIHGHLNLKAAHWGDKDTRLLFRSKHIAPKPRIARAPELVIIK